MGELEGAPSFVPIRLIRALSWAEIINRFLTFTLSQTPRNYTRKGESEQSLLLAHGFPYCVSQHNKDVG